MTSTISEVQAVYLQLPRREAPSTPREARLAVLIPCFNEAATIGTVVEEFRVVAPSAAVYVFDNNSTDGSAAIAEASGAIVVRVLRQGKGNVVRAMMSRIDAEVYVMVDADDTYPAARLHELVSPVLSGDADMVVGARLDTALEDAFRPLHALGNRAFCRLVSLIFGTTVTDMLSGYRAFNARVARCLPIVSSGFEVEAEMTIQCMYYNFTILEVPIDYRPRPTGSSSKLSTFKDGFRILAKVINLLRAYKPLTFFGLLGLLSFGLALVLNALALNVGMIGQLRDLLLWSSGVSVGIGVMLHTLNYRVKELHTVLMKSKWLQ